jgi:hypothetical protein
MLLPLLAYCGRSSVPAPPTVARARPVCQAELLLTLDEVESAARRVGCTLKVDATGPVYRVELLWDDGKQLPAPQIQTLGYNDDKPPPPELLGYSDGFTQPTGVTHLETIEVRKFTGFWARKKERGAKRYAASRKLQPGLLVSLAVACWVREKGAFGNPRAQLLCIRDDERQHRSLIRFYRKLGFRPLREVGSDLGSIADRVVWGGEGTIMEVELDFLRKRFADSVRALGVQAS